MILLSSDEIAVQRMQLKSTLQTELEHTSFVGTPGYLIMTHTKCFNAKLICVSYTAQNLPLPKACEDTTTFGIAHMPERNSPQKIICPLHISFEQTEKWIKCLLLPMLKVKIFF